MALALTVGLAGPYFFGGPENGGFPAFGFQDQIEKRNMTAAQPGGTQPIPGPQKLTYAPNVVVVAFRDGTPMLARQAKAARLDLIEDGAVRSPYFHRYFIGPDAIRAGETVDSMVNRLKADKSVRYAEPDFAIYPDQPLPNDPSFNQQWGLHNIGQSGGTNDADIDWPEAIAAAPGPGSTVVVSVLDDGCQWNHVDLAANIWVNQDEIPGNGIDDDSNGFIDDVRGWDFASNDNDPAPAGGATHGTHTSGTVAAVTNNALGVAGVAVNVRLMPIRMYSGQSTWMTALAQGIDYSWQNGAKVMSVSYNVDGFTQTLNDAIGRAKTADAIYCNSAGNNGQQNPPRQALRSQHNNVVLVAATDRNDGLASFSNYGSLVEIGAPGVDVISTIPTNSYGLSSGTSMACPHMAGACAVIRSQYPALTARQTLDRLIGTAEMKPALVGKVTGGRLNLNRALETDTVPPSDPTNLVWLAYSSSSLKIRFNGSGDDGTVGQASSYDIRISPNPITPANFAAAQQVPNQITPVNHGVAITTEVGGLSPGQTRHLAVRAVDNMGNVSNILAGGPFSTRPGVVDTVEGTSWFSPTSGPWAITTEQPYQGTRSWSDSPSANYGNNLNIELRSQRLVMTGPTTFNFMVKHALESHDDWLWWDVSLDEGATWTNLGSLTGTSSGWTLVSCPLPDYPGSRLTKKGFHIRFRMTSDASVVLDGVYLDNLFLTPMSVSHFDTMEGAANYTGDAPWARTNVRSFSPTQSWTDSPAGNYANSVNLNLTSNIPVDTSNLANAFLAFKAFISAEKGFDFLNVLTSVNGGSYVQRGGWSGLLNQWNAYTVPTGSGTVLHRFNFTTDSSVVAEGVYVDDVMIGGEPFTPAP